MDPAISNMIKYTPLQENQIRILTLFADQSKEAQIKCSLRSFSDPPPYIALSYTWGNTKETRDIFVNEQVFKATENLEDALKHLRNAKENQYFWVDAICINQDDKDEKGHQLRLMPTIFSQAQETRVWLGSEGADSNRAIDLINSLAAIQTQNSNNEITIKSDAVIDEGSLEPSTPWTNDVDLVALQDLLIRNYWYRVWIVQEIAMSKKVVIICGLQELSWNAVCNAIELMVPDKKIGWEIYNHITHHPSLSQGVSGGVRCNTLLDGAHRILAIQSVRKDKLDPADPGRPQDSLLFLLSKHRSTQATNAEDKYYALAGLVREENTILAQRSSSLPLEDIYMLAAESTSRDQQHGALDFLDCAGWPIKQKDLPSWVPDWSYTRDRAVPLLYWQLAGQKHKDMLWLNATGPRSTSLTNTYSFEKKEKRLLAQGLQFDSINGVGFSHWVPRNEDPNVQNPEEPPMLEHKKYPTGEALADAIWKTHVLNFAYTDGLEAPPDWGDLFYQQLLRPEGGSRLSASWYERNKGFEIYGVKLEDIAREQRKVRPDVEFGHDSATDNTFRQLLGEFGGVARYRRLATTTNGYLCMAPSTSQMGDMIVILFDCHVPVVLRGEGKHFKFIGTCYVHGIMQGEGMDGLNDRVLVEYCIQ